MRGQLYVTTKIRLPGDLKASVASAAALAGVTAHAFILEAIAERTSQAEARAALVRVGRERLGEFEATGMAIPWAEARQYLLDPAAGQKVARPRARKIGR